MAREMKKSGVDWIGQIPNDWGTIRFKYLHNGMNTGEGIDKELWSSDESDIVFYTAGIEPIRTKYKDFPDWKYTNENDLLLSRNGTPYVYLPSKSACYTDHIIRACIKPSINRAFVRYSLQQSISSVVVDSVSLATWSASLWNKLVIAWPSEKEQARTVSFLNTECSSIDAVIEKTRASIEEYKKLKQSVITQAVTKGIRPNREMKDSGIEWIGDIPESWNVCKLRHIGVLQNGISKGGEYFGEGFPFVSYGDVYKNIALPKALSGLIQSSEAEQALYSVKKGDIFFTRTSETIEEVGFSSVCEETIPHATFAGFLIRLRPINNTLDIGYSKYYFRSSHHRIFLAKQMNIVTRASLGQPLLKSMPVLIPNKEEQTEISRYLDDKCSEIDRVIEKKEQLIAELESYKKSLIYEYLTGKKEVPN